MKTLLIACTLFLSTFCSATEISITVKQELNYLFSQLKNSGCQFNRNGSWYTAAEAAAHIQKKYEYLARKSMIKTTESFIQQAATESSVSGKAYQVKCEGQTSMPSSTWFDHELKIYRSTKNLSFLRITANQISTKN
jgi:hypothetical protein